VPSFQAIRRLADTSYAYVSNEIFLEFGEGVWLIAASSVTNIPDKTPYLVLMRQRNQLTKNSVNVVTP
jgi:hypothetical protein